MFKSQNGSRQMHLEQVCLDIACLCGVKQTAYTKFTICIQIFGHCLLEYCHNLLLNGELLNIVIGEADETKTVIKGRVWCFKFVVTSFS